MTAEDRRISRAVADRLIGKSINASLNILRSELDAMQRSTGNRPDRMLCGSDLYEFIYNSMAQNQRLGTPFQNSYGNIIFYGCNVILEPLIPGSVCIYITSLNPLHPLGNKITQYKIGA